MFNPFILTVVLSSRVLMYDNFLDFFHNSFTTSPYQPIFLQNETNRKWLSTPGSKTPQKRISQLALPTTPYPNCHITIRRARRGPKLARSLGAGRKPRTKVEVWVRPALYAWGPCTCALPCEPPFSHNPLMWLLAVVGQVKGWSGDCSGVYDYARLITSHSKVRLILVKLSRTDFFKQIIGY